MKVIGRMVARLDAVPATEPPLGALDIGIRGIAFARPWLSYDQADGEVIVVLRGGDLVGDEPTWTASAPVLP